MTEQTETKGISFKELLHDSLVHIDKVERRTSMTECAIEWLKLKSKYGSSIRKVDYLEVKGISRSGLDKHLRLLQEKQAEK